MVREGWERHPRAASRVQRGFRGVIFYGDSVVLGAHRWRRPCGSWMMDERSDAKEQVAGEQRDVEPSKTRDRFQQ